MGAVVPLVGSAVFLAQTPGTPVPEPEACAFTVAADGREPEFVGPPEAVARTRALSQPDSPLVVRRVGLSDLHLSFGGSGADPDGSWTVDVQNVTDQAIEDAAVRIQIGNERGYVGGGSAFKGPFMPGETLRLTVRSHGQGVDPTASMGDTLELLVLIESIQLPRCFCRPAQAIPRAGRGRR